LSARSGSKGYSIEIQNEVGAENLPAERMVAAVHHVLDQHEVADNTTLTVVISDDSHVQELNMQFRGVDAPTDVLSFPADPLPEAIEGEAPYLGDLIIAYPYTSREVAETGHSLDDELVLLVIHGTLHLLGYDHDNEVDQDEMWAEQSDALVAAKVAIVVPRFTFGPVDIPGALDGDPRAD